MKVALGLFIVCCLAVGYAQEPVSKSNEIASYNLIDDIIRGVLNSLRKTIADLKIADIKKSFTSELLNATFSAKNIAHQNVDSFEIKNLKTSLVPLKLNNITLRWKSINGNALYDFDVEADVNHDSDPTKIFGKGMASASLDDIIFTIGAELHQKNGKFQIKPNGLFGFDVKLLKAQISLESLMGSEELGKVVGQLISDMLPLAVDEFKYSLFELFKQDIIDILNEMLRGKKIALDDEISYQSEESEEFQELENLSF